MSTEKRDGFVLTFVIVLLGLVGVVMFVLTGGSNTMLFEADAAHVQAVDRNLAASGLAWARHRAAQADSAASDEPVSLDMASLGAGGVGLTVQITERDAAVYCRIETSAAKGRQSVSNSREYMLPSP